MKATAPDLFLDYVGALKAGDNRHAVEIMKSLGITYEHAEPQPIADQWKFHACSNIPDALPSYLRFQRQP